MANAAAWFMLFLGFGHILFGLLKFKKPVAQAIADGYIGKFAVPEVRRAFPKSPFWAPLLVAPVLIAAGFGFLP